MQVLVSDIWMLVDLERGSLLQAAFALPSCSFAVPDLLFERELKDHGGTGLLELGLRVEALSDDGVVEAGGYRRAKPFLSVPDSFAPALARGNGWALLTVDGLWRDLGRDARTRRSTRPGCRREWAQDVTVLSTLWYPVVKTLWLFGYIRRPAAHWPRVCATGGQGMDDTAATTAPRRFECAGGDQALKNRAGRYADLSREGTSVADGESGRAGDGLIAPLRKRTLNGGPYTRDPANDALLAELSSLPRDELIARAAVPRRGDPGYVPSECLVYLIRASRAENAGAWFERLYRILAERVLRRLPKAESSDGKTESLTRGVIRDKVLGRFAELLSADRVEYSEKLDFFEVRFDGALASLRRDAQAQAWRDENRSTLLEYDDETGEPSAEVERAAGHFDPFALDEIGASAYRSRLDQAIEALPPEQSRIVEMLRQGFPIDSKEAGVMTIAKALGRSERTVRSYRDKAFAALRSALTEGAAR